MLKKCCEWLLCIALVSGIPSLHAAETRKNGYEELLRNIQHHNRLYFQKHSPAISDSEYDLLLRELLQIEKEHPEWVRPSSPSQTMGSDLLRDKPSSAHLRPMLSINSIQTLPELHRFWQRIKHELKTHVDYVVEEKIDGVAISLQYKHGRLEKALTRGDGLNGNDVTDHIRHIQSVPTVLEGDVPALIEIRGEIYVPKENLAAMKRQDGGKYANPRNAAAGILNTKRPLKNKLRLLHMIPHSIGFTSEPVARMQAELLNRFERFGFPARVGQTVCSSMMEIEAAISTIERNQEKLPYDIDSALRAIRGVKMVL